MVAVYIFTLLITFSWLTKIIIYKKIIFKRTLLDIPLIIFFLTQLLSTLVSIDRRTSFLGYYSRFHGGLLSTFCYSLLYWAYVSNLGRKEVVRSVYFLLSSAFLVSIYSVFQHFGIDKNVWVQDVQSRVFSTLGQPNWLAAWLVALIPVQWAFYVSSKPKRKDEKFSFRNYYLYNWSNFFERPLLSYFFFATLLYTKSRSGILAFITAFILFWGYSFWLYKDNLKPFSLKFIRLTVFFLILAFYIGTPWTIGLEMRLGQKANDLSQVTGNQPPTTLSAPALEVGGTESVEIRKIVWRGAIDVWKNYPVLGSGVETFAFSYYKFRPVEHNLTSEWDYLYNKAHNEYLNFLATTGSFGLLTYLLLIVVILYQFREKATLSGRGRIEPDMLSSFRRKLRAISAGRMSLTLVKSLITNRQLPINPKNSKSENSKDYSLFTIHCSLFAGFTSILITNFFGFSVVPVAILFFLYPALSVGLQNESKKVLKSKFGNLSAIQKLGIIISGSITFFFLYSIGKYWYADILFAKGKTQSDSSNYSLAVGNLQKATKLSPNEAIYWNELSQAEIEEAVKLTEDGDKVIAKRLALKAISDSDKAISLSSFNVNLKRDRASMFIKLSVFESPYLILARKTLEEAVSLAPTDAKLFYNLSLSYLRTGDTEKALQILQKTIKMKPDYKNAYYALGLIYIDEKKYGLAREQFEYILEHLDPNDQDVIRELNELLP